MAGPGKPDNLILAALLSTRSICTADSRQDTSRNSVWPVRYSVPAKKCPALPVRLYCTELTHLLCLHRVQLGVQQESEAGRGVAGPARLHFQMRVVTENLELF